MGFFFKTEGQHCVQPVLPACKDVYQI